MSKEKARGPQSYKNEELLMALLPELLSSRGFEAVRDNRRGGMKFVDARDASGGAVSFWVKQGWTDAKNFAAIQFGMFKGRDPADIPDAEFVEYVTLRTQSAKTKGATHALLVHLVDEHISNFVALRIDDVSNAFSHQIAEWPKRARNTKTPTLFFEDDRHLEDAACVAAVTNLEVSLESICGRPSGRVAPAKPAPGSKKLTAEVERRMRQQVFRLLVGSRCKWKCVVSGNTVRQVLDAAHLPGKNWREDNEAEDGVLVRTDLHRLLDRGLAEIKGDLFVLAPALRKGVYAEFHNRKMTLA